jgi:outer membrane receptor protein involved in Fe transport
MTKLGLLESSALRSAVFLGLTTLIATPAYSQAQPNVPAPNQQAQEEEEVNPAPETQGEPTDTASGATEDETGESIVVTGSRIPRPEASGTIPGVQVQKEQIVSRGFTNAADILNDIPLVGPSGANLNSAAPGQAPSIGNAFVDLLDLGTARTLTLVNGRRFVSGNAASLFVADNAPGGQVDVNVIPVALIDRVDVLTVGGAAAYGTDAIAGVVNYILRDDFDGIDLTGIAGITSRGDGASYTIRGTAGHNFGADNRGNVVVSGEYNKIEGIQANQRSFRRDNAGFFANANFLNGGVRNPNFSPSVPVGASPFLSSLSDQQPSFLALPNATTLVLSPGGNVFQFTGAFPNNATACTPTTPPAQLASCTVPITLNPNATVIGPTPVVNSTGALAGNPQSFVFSGAQQLIPGTTVSAALARCDVANLTNFCLLAPNALPGTANSAAQNTFAQAVITRFAPTLVNSGTDNPNTPANEAQQQRNALALQLLQQNRLTPREFFALNPNVPLNAFIGNTVPGYLDVANTNTTPVNIGGGITVPLNQVLPRIAVPLQFNANGDLVGFSQGQIDPTTGSLTGAAPNAEGLNQTRFTALRVEQERYIANFIGKYDLTDWLTVFTENLYAKTKNTSNVNAASANTAGGTAVETAGLSVSINNPFLTAANRATLQAAGVTDRFVLSRSNQDIFGDNPITNDSETIRTVLGLRGDFGLFGQNFNWEVSGTYGESTQITRSNSIKDIEYALAVDAVQTPQGIRCRAQVEGLAPGSTIQGINRDVILAPGPDGLPTLQFFTPRVTAEQIAACVPLNPFGVNRMSEEAKEYVRAETEFRNKSEQLFFQATLGGTLFNLPAGGLSVALNGEFRREKLALVGNDITSRGLTRNAASIPTAGEIETLEGGAEARIPITGEDFTLPLLGEIELNPAVRFSRQDGQGTRQRLLTGVIAEQKLEGKFNTIWSIAGTWRPVPDLLFRGNITRSIRNPSIVELFLGGQSAFQNRNDVCGPGLIGQGANPTGRRANCIADVIRLGIRPDAASAGTFLDAFTPDTSSLQGVFGGSVALEPEKGRSKTAGLVIAPRFLPGFSVSADYIHLNLQNVIVPIGVFQANQFCYDSPNFPDTTEEFRTNLCTTFTRDPTTFQLQNGFAGAFLNLSGTKVRAVNFSARAPFTLPFDLGKLTLSGNAYHLLRYDESSSGAFTPGDTTRSAGTFARPRWEIQASARYDIDEFYTQLTWNHRSPTRIFSGGAPATIELVPEINYPATDVFDLAIGVQATDQFRFQLVVQNLTDETFAGQLGFNNLAFVDQIGRRFQVTTSIRF